MEIYHITDWLGLVPVFICMIFGEIGFIQLMKRRSFLKVDYDIIFLGIYYVIVILIMFVFLVVVGIIKLILTKLGMQRYNKIATRVSMSISTLSVFLLAITRESYAVAVVFLLLVMKGILFF